MRDGLVGACPRWRPYTIEANGTSGSPVAVPVSYTHLTLDAPAPFAAALNDFLATIG